MTGSNILVVSAAVLMLSIPARGGLQGMGEPAHAAAVQERTAEPSPRPKRAPAKPAYEEHQVAAGSYLPIELRSPLSSTTNRVGDRVEGRLLRAITIDGIELVPSGATVLGSLTEVEPATARDRGRVVLTFNVIEHPQTGSRATIKTSALMFESDLPRRRKPLPEVRVEKGADATVALLAPLLVRLPIVD